MLYEVITIVDVDEGAVPGVGDAVSAVVRPGHAGAGLMDVGPHRQRAVAPDHALGDDALEAGIGVVEAEAAVGAGAGLVPDPRYEEAAVFAELVPVSYNFV